MCSIFRKWQEAITDWCNCHHYHIFTHQNCSWTFPTGLQTFSLLPWIWKLDGVVLVFIFHSSCGVWFICWLWVSTSLAMAVCINYTVDCLVKPGAVFEEVSSHWSLCFDVYSHITNNFENATATNTVCGLLWSNILHVILSSCKWSCVMFSVPLHCHWILNKITWISFWNSFIGFILFHCLTDFMWYKLYSYCACIKVLKKPTKYIWLCPQISYSNCQFLYSLDTVCILTFKNFGQWFLVSVVIMFFFLAMKSHIKIVNSCY